MKKPVILSSTDLKAKMLQVKKGWPTYVSYSGLYQNEFGKLTKSKKEELRNIWNLRATDQGIIDRLEFLYEKFVKKRA